MSLTRRGKGKAGKREVVARGSAERKAPPLSGGTEASATAESAGDKPAETDKRLMASLVANGTMGNASTMVSFASGTFGELSLVDATMVLRETAQNVHGGDLSSAELMLTAQAGALNAIFGELARRSALNMGDYLDTAERYMRLALKAQGQCRATLETLATIKNPPVVFARQANINNGGQQQVNNGAQPAPTAMSSDAHAENPKTGQTELLEASDGKGLDTRAAGTAGGADPQMETVGAINRASHR